MIKYKPQALCVIQTNFVNLLWVSIYYWKYMLCSPCICQYVVVRMNFFLKIHVMFPHIYGSIVVNVRLFVKANLCHVLLIFVDLLWTSTFVKANLVWYVVSIEFCPKTHHICWIIGWGQVVQTQPITYHV